MPLSNIVISILIVKLAQIMEKAPVQKLEEAKAATGPERNTA